jgi:peptidyl-prolyl cis-trans isomerase-like 3
MSVTLHTSLGDIKLEVFCDTSPRTSFNFLALCASGYYNGTLFHRNIPGFMIQGGSRKESAALRGSVDKVEDASIWGTGVSFDNEFHPNNLHEQRGVVSMANLQGPNTNRCQFFLTYQRQAHLNHQYTVFGRVLDGWDVLDKMEALVPMSDAAAAATAGNKKKKNVQFRPLHPPVIKAVTIHANPLADDYIVYPTPDGPPEKRI